MKLRVKLGMLACVAMVLGLLAVASPVSSTDADAFCGSSAGSHTYHWESWGAEYYRFWPTCNDNNTVYAGMVYDAVTDGYCVSAEFQPANGNYGPYQVQGYSCTTGGWSYYDYWGVWYWWNGQWNLDKVADVRVCKYGTNICSFPTIHNGVNA